MACRSLQSPQDRFKSRPGSGFRRRSSRRAGGIFVSRWRTRVTRAVSVRLIGAVLVCAAAGWAAHPDAAQRTDDRIPAFEFDPTWPQTPLPNNWILGVIG